jgi:hypothetical protein
MWANVRATDAGRMTDDLTRTQDRTTHDEAPIAPPRAAQDIACIRARRISAVIGAAVSTVIAWTFLDQVSGVDMAVKSGSSVSHVGVVAVALTALCAGLAGWGLLAWLERTVKRPRRTWTIIAVAALVLSLLGPLGGVNAAAMEALAALPLTAATSIIVGLRRSTRRLGR